MKYGMIYFSSNKALRDCPASFSTKMSTEKFPVLCSRVAVSLFSRSARLNGAISSPLLVGKLSPLSLLTQNVHAGVFNNRVKN